MTKIRTEDQLLDLLDYEFSWRLKEIHDLRAAARTAARSSRQTFIRAGVALLYAHWEGFVKAGAEGYVNYIACRGIQHSELRACFAALGLKRHLQEFASANRSEASMAALGAILEEFNKPARLPLSGSISTQSNLSSVVFKDIVGWIGLDAERYSTKFRLLDESLLNMRNKVTHGDKIDLQESAFRELVDQILLLLRWFKTDIENALATNAFMKPED